MTDFLDDKIFDIYDQKQIEEIIHQRIKVNDSIESEILDYLAANWSRIVGEQELAKKLDKNPSDITKALNYLVPISFVFLAYKSSERKVYINYTFLPFFLLNATLRKQAYLKHIEPCNSSNRVFHGYTTYVVSFILRILNIPPNKKYFGIDFEDRYKCEYDYLGYDFTPETINNPRIYLSSCQILIYKITNLKGVEALFKNSTLNILKSIFTNGVYYPTRQGLDCDHLFNYFEENLFPEGLAKDEVILLQYVEVLFLKGRFQAVEKNLENSVGLSLFWTCLTGCLSQDDIDVISIIKTLLRTTDYIKQASNIFDSIIIMRWILDPNSSGYKNVLSASSKNRAAFSSIISIVDNLKRVGSQNTSYFKTFEIPLSHQILDSNDIFDHEEVINHIYCTWDDFGKLVYTLALYWFESKELANYVTLIEQCFSIHHKRKNKWLAHEFGHLLLEIKPETEHKEAIDALSNELKTKPLCTFYKTLPLWERQLSQLIDISAKKKTSKADKRIVWRISTYEKMITPIIQMQKKHDWVDSQTQFQKVHFVSADYVTERDKHVLRTASSYQSYSPYTPIEFEKALLALVDHPFVFSEDNKKITVSKATIYLELNQSKKNVSVKFNKKLNPNEDIFYEESQDGHYFVCRITPKMKEIFQILGNDGLVVPLGSKDQLLKVLKLISTDLVILSNTDEVSFEKINTIDGSGELLLRLLPYQTGLELDVFVSPFSNREKEIINDSFLLKPCVGSKQIIDESNGEKTVVIRQFDKEKDAIENLMKNIPCLQSTQDQIAHWVFTDPGEALELIDALGEHPNYRIEWPKGEPFKISGRSSLKSFSLSITNSTNWLDVDGKVQFDDGEIYSLKKVLSLLEISKSRFIQLKDKHFLSISKDLKEKLENIAGICHTEKDRIHATKLSISALEDTLKDIEQIDGDGAWLQILESAQKAKNHIPKKPTTLQAELRPYQFEGFQWLSRLAAWGAGACLADDMGLGKTVQSIAILLERATLGPALVISPVSISDNWINEINRFAPTLKPHQLRNFKANDNLEDFAGKFDVILCSYGLMQQRIESFQNIKFSTVILDEAQAIKNHDSKRFKAAMQLNGDFKILTTGTPVENHLMELWSLFAFINPGLLGTKNQFLEKFFNPIHRAKDSNANKYLKQIIQPFVLRRLKKDVLAELPEKIEVNRYVEMSEQEVNFYESVRQLSIEKLESGDDPTENKALQVLTEITKLRRACCHPDLIAPELKIPSSKMEEFDHIVDELIENNHKALIFSQFVGFLKIIEEHIKKKNISYQYLDGSTPPAKRQELVDKFQAGEGNLFLISLKAGGSGLNLTAANFVIHMDPWWNPAVEDQATDRTHRIGQKQPVTVYRIITKGTIEEKIISLHAAKRDMADALLEGSEGSGKLNSNDLFELLKTNLSL